MTIEQNRELIRRFDDAVAAGDVGALDELCTQDMVNHSLAPNRPKGLEGTREFIRTGMPQLHEDGWTDSVMVAEGDYVVQFGVRGGTWRGGPFLGIDADPGPYSARGRVLLPDRRRQDRRTLGDPRRPHNAPSARRVH